MSDISDYIREAVITILSKYNAEKIIIFGSYARGTAKSDSDLDILVCFSSPKSLFQIVRIESELKQTLNMNVDLLTENAVSPYLAKSIHQNEMVIYDALGSGISPPLT